MEYELKGIHYEISDRTREYLTKKFKRLEFGSELITALTISITREKSRYAIEANVNFRWGVSSHVGIECVRLYKGIELITDKLENKIRKEKEKIKEHK